MTSNVKLILGLPPGARGSTQFWWDAPVEKATKPAQVNQFKSQLDTPATPPKPTIGQHRVNSYDSAIEVRKLPPNKLDVEQRIASAGESLPIVFGKAESFFGGGLVIGGVWVAPSIIRTSCQPKYDNDALNQLPNPPNEGTGEFIFGSVFPVSQGKLVSQPSESQIYIGQQRLRTLTGIGDVDIYLDYKDASFMAANPNFCPIELYGASCSNAYLTWFEGSLTSSPTKINSRSANTQGFGTRFLFRTTGPLNNTVVEYDIKQIDAVSGEQINVGTITGFVFVGFDRDLKSSYVGSANWPFITSLGRSGAYSLELTLNFIDYQLDIAEPADTNTITDIQIAAFNSNVYGGVLDPKFPDFTAVDTRGYADISVMSIEGRLIDEENNQKQIYMYFEEGVEVTLYSQGATGGNYAKGSSNKFIDLAFYLFTTYKQIEPTTNALYGSIIDDTDAKLLSDFNTELFALCNGVIDVSVNITQWISENANYFLLAFINVDGKYRFAPLLPIVSTGGLLGGPTLDLGVIAPKFTFNETTILEGSYSKQYIAPYDRDDIIVSIVFRESTAKQVGRAKTVEVFYKGTSLDAPREQFDLTDVCVDSFHAVTFAGYQLSKRRNTTHSISFETFLPDIKLIPTDVIAMSLTRKTTAGDDRTEVNLYQITEMTFAQNGVTSIVANEFKLNEAGSSIVALDTDVLGNLDTFDVIFDD